jgi:hypothetical protein
MSSATDIHPRLITGWEPDVPVADTLLRRFLTAWGSACEAFAVAGGGRAVCTPDFAAADYGRPSGWFNTATLLGPPDPARFETLLDDVEMFFRSGTGETLLLSAWPLPDLRRRGWRLVGHPPLLVRPPAALVPPPASPPVDIVDAEDAALLAEWERVAVEGYPLPELFPVRPGAVADPGLLRDPRLQFTLGREGGAAVSLGALFVEAGIGCFTLGVTRPEARGRGHWRAHAIRRLLAAPDLWMTGIFSDDSRPPAERLGFLPLFRLTLWARPRPSAGALSTTRSTR